MLRPDSNRVDYGEELYPPEGYVISYAVGCTYSLSLDTLISIPVSLALSSEMKIDKSKGKIHILDGLIKTTNKMKVYCQKGKISVPKNTMSLYSLLENSISEVLPKDNSSFHPKIWVIRYDSKVAKKRAKYKVIVLSRNLTGDRSYDISMSIDGIVTTETEERNKELCDYVKYLSKLEDFAGSRKFIKELGQVKFDLSGSLVESLNFIPMIEGKYNCDLLTKQCDNLLIISPFLSDNILSDLSKISDSKPKLISRKEEFLKMNQDILKRFKCYHLKDEIVDGESILDIENNEEVRKQDIHSKIYVKEKGKKTELYLGSANCSNRAFNSNIEFLSMLNFRSKDYNVEKAFNEISKIDDDISLLTEYIEAENIIDINKDYIEEVIDYIERKIIKMEFKGEVKKNKNNTYNILINSLESIENLNLKDNYSSYSDIKITIRPLTILNKKKTFSNNIEFKDIELSDITSFFVIEITIEDITRKLIIKGKLKNIPEERTAQILKEILNNEKVLLNYISFLLGEPTPVEIVSLITETSNDNMNEGTIGLVKRAMFEKLLRAVSRDREKIKEVRNIINILGDEDIVPRELKEMLEAFQNYV